MGRWDAIDNAFAQAKARQEDEAQRAAAESVTYEPGTEPAVRVEPATGGQWKVVVYYANGRHATVAAYAAKYKAGEHAERLRAEVAR